jgi:succinate dehydrogenase / fumarate reductase cytochrome b subunit
MHLLPRLVHSSLGKKYVMAVTGLLLIGFVLAHMAGNLLIFFGPDAINSYAAALKAKPYLLWPARVGLLVVFLIHLYVAFRLTYENYAARPQGYVHERTLQASFASRHMMLTGMVLLAFIVYHLAHFTFGVVTRADGQVAVNGAWLPADKNYLDLTEIHPSGMRAYIPASDQDYRLIDPKTVDARHDVYSMVVSGFRNPWISLSYIVAMLFLGLHLWHGGGSWLESLGLGAPASTVPHASSYLGPILAVIVVAGNCAIPISVWLGIFTRTPLP